MGLYGNYDTREFYARANNGDFVLHTGIVCRVKNYLNQHTEYYNGNSILSHNDGVRMMVWKSAKHGWCVTDWQSGLTYGGNPTRESAINRLIEYANDIDDGDDAFFEYFGALCRDARGLRKYVRDIGRKPKCVKPDMLVKNGYLDRVYGYPEFDDPSIPWDQNITPYL